MTKQLININGQSFTYTPWVEGQSFPRTLRPQGRRKNVYFQRSAQMTPEPTSHARLLSHIQAYKQEIAKDRTIVRQAQQITNLTDERDQALDLAIESENSKNYWQKRALSAEKSLEQQKKSLEQQKKRSAKREKQLTQQSAKLQDLLKRATELLRRETK